MLPDNVLFTDSPADTLTRFVQNRHYSTVVTLVDENTKVHCLPLLPPACTEHVIEVESGERNKTLTTCERIWNEMTQLALDRHALLVVVGGGVLGDMGGFCAATYKRGIDFVLIPTTLLAQVDASIGGKLGVDFLTFKNHIGVFQQPALTLLHSGFLATLPHPELRSGFAEVLKHCLISDAEMWRQITTRRLEEQDWDTLIRHSVEFKARITVEDPTEKGIRKILNAGHTIGHAVESHMLKTGRPLLHGEAIAIGLVAETWIARERGLVAKEQQEEIDACILRYFRKVDMTNEDIEAAAMLTVQDKKNKGQRILCVLPEGIGKARLDVEISKDEVKSALAYYTSIQM